MATMPSYLAGIPPLEEAWNALAAAGGADPTQPFPLPADLKEQAEALVNANAAAIEGDTVRLIEEEPLPDVPAAPGVAKKQDFAEDDTRR